MSVPETDKGVALMKHLRGDIPDPAPYFAWLCRVSGVKWVPSDVETADEVLSGAVDGVRVTVSRAEWMPLDGDRGIDLLARKLKEARP